ncbi:MAG TPA: hypothetical protein QF520_12270, partial [SAR202 cluster bacterium]|nr:hypothetical protein [SAR202 cluster bacterium]
RQNTVIPPLRKLSLKQYVRVLMYGEAVQMGTAIGAIGRPYVEYFSDHWLVYRLRYIRSVSGRQLEST